MDSKLPKESGNPRFHFLLRLLGIPAQEQVNRIWSPKTAGKRLLIFLPSLPIVLKLFLTGL